MTQSTHPVENIRPISAKPKRAGSRFTSGHLLMVISGMLAFLLTLILLTSRQATVTVFVARDTIVAGNQITRSQFEPRSIPSSDLNSKYVTAQQLTSSNKYYASRTINKGEPLLAGDRSPEASKSDVRLISIPIDKSLAVAGAIAKGDRIDVISTPDGDCAVRVLSNLEVVVTPASSGGGALSGGSGGYTITVAIDESGDDLTLAGVVATGAYQVVKSTGVQDRNPTLIDPYCDSGFSTEDE